MLIGLTLLGCGPRAPLAVWIGGDVQVTQPTPQRFSTLAMIDGVGIVNLEGPVGSPLRPISATHLVNHVRVPQLLKAAGVAVIGLANNHRDDRGLRGVQASVAAIESAGLHAADRGRTVRLRSPNSAAQVVVGEARDLAQMQAELRKAIGRRALRIASLHVQAPPSYLPSPSTRRAVEGLLAAGAEVVAVHGSHALGPVERRGTAIIAWGLGNLAFDCPCTREDEALILRVWRAGRGVAGAVVPIQAGLGGRPVKRHPDAAGIIALLQGLGSHVDAEGQVHAASNDAPESAVVRQAGSQTDSE